MSQFKVYQDYSQDATMVSNIFIDTYMKDANDAQIKIYLYLLRVLSSNMGCSISDLADQFNYTEKDVHRALKYWEKNNLLSLDYDENKTLVGVRLLDVVERKDNSIVLAPVVPLPIQSLITEDSYKKPEYSTDDIMSFKSNESTKELLFVVEQYLGKSLTVSDVKTVLFFSEVLEFSNELIDFLFDYCVGRGKKDFRYIEKVALSWKEQGITTPKQAAKASKKYDKVVYDTMNALGKSNSPTKKEVDFINRWTTEFGFEFEIIKEACERTVMATDAHRFEYADKILSSWFEKNVHHKSDIGALDASHQESTKAKRVSANNQAAAFKQFSQRSYDYDELERQILSN
ncbi:MAG: DnaD domain protein [Lachnospiraceae bacterium]|nr:DnaD domain protein [Lachnospiraceae bacterium]